MPMFQPDVNGANLQQIFDLVGPGSAGQYFGEQNQARQDMNGINQQLSLADLDKVGQENAQSRIVNPYLADIQAANSREANSKTGAFFNQMRQGEMGKARSQVVEGDIAEQTKVGKIGAQNAESVTSQMHQAGTQLAQLGAYINTLPMSERHAAFEQLADQHGIKGPLYDRFAKLGPEDLSKNLGMVAQNMMTADPKLLAELTKGREHNATLIKVGEGNNAAMVAAAGIRAKAGSGGGKLVSDFLKADDAKKAGYIDLLVKQAISAGESTIDLPTGETISVQDGVALARHFTDRFMQGKQVGRPQASIPGIDMNNPAGAAVSSLYDTPGGGGKPSDEQLRKMYGGK